MMRAAFDIARGGEDSKLFEHAVGNRDVVSLAAKAT
jgi:hypothetical protein